MRRRLTSPSPVDHARIDHLQWMGGCWVPPARYDPKLLATSIGLTSVVVDQVVEACPASGVTVRDIDRVIVQSFRDLTAQSQDEQPEQALSERAKPQRVGAAARSVASVRQCRASCGLAAFRSAARRAAPVHE